MPLSRPTRRQFIRYAALSATATSLYGQSIIGANNRLRFAVVGCGLRSAEHIKALAKLSSVEVVAVCDPDTAHMDKAVKNLSDAGMVSAASTVDKIADYRKLYERPDIDAVVIASPNYWHALHAIHALQAGKHVYVEKPISFTLWEAQQLKAAERKYGKIIAAGYQNRSDVGCIAGINYVHEGNLGKIQKVRSLCYRNRTSIGKRETPLLPPETVDYNLWLGPAEDQTLMRPQFHYDWHWDFNTGQGDTGNQAVHEIDLVCWLLGEKPLPTEIRSFGNRFAWDDAGNTPNMQTAWFNIDDVDVILETNDLRLSPTRNVPATRFGTRVGIVAECENGFLKGGRGGMVALAKDHKTIIERFPGDGGGSHMKNFIQAIRDNDASILRSTIADAATSASLANLGNISYRLGPLTDTRDLESALSGNEDLLEILSDQNKQLAEWGINDPKYYLGKNIEVDPVTETITTKNVSQELTGPNYRKGFELKPVI